MGLENLFSLNYRQLKLVRVAKTMRIVKEYPWEIPFRAWNRRPIQMAAATVSVNKQSKKEHYQENDGKSRISINYKKKLELKSFLFGGLPVSISSFSSNVSTPLLLRHFSRKRAGIQKPLLLSRKRRMKSDMFLTRFCSAKPKIENPRAGIKPDVEKMLNSQIAIEYQAGYDYLSMALYFGRNDIALIGCERFYYDMYLEEMEHSRTFMRYLNMRGGLVTLAPVAAPKISLPKGLLSALDLSVQMETHVKDTLIQLCEVASKNQDHSLEELLTGFFILEQEKSISGLTRLLTRLKRMDPDCPLTVYLFDEEMGRTVDMREFENENFGPYKSLHQHGKSGL